MVNLHDVYHIIFLKSTLLFQLPRPPSLSLPLPLLPPLSIHNLMPPTLGLTRSSLLSLSSVDRNTSYSSSSFFKAFSLESSSS